MLIDPHDPFLRETSTKSPKRVAAWPQLAGGEGLRWWLDPYKARRNTILLKARERDELWPGASTRREGGAARRLDAVMLTARRRRSRGRGRMGRPEAQRVRGRTIEATTLQRSMLSIFARPRSVTRPWWLSGWHSLRREGERGFSADGVQRRALGR
jgi:hypothetical protein